MIELKKCFGKGFGWICALNRWSVQERTQTSFCPTAHQVLHYLAWQLCRQIAARILSRLTPFSLWGVRKGGWGEGSFWAGGPKFTRDCHEIFFDASCLYQLFSYILAKQLLSKHALTWFACQFLRSSGGQPSVFNTLRISATCDCWRAEACKPQSTPESSG